MSTHKNFRSFERTLFAVLIVIVLATFLIGIIVTYSVMAKRSLQSRPTESPSEEYDENPADVESSPETSSPSNSTDEQNSTKRESNCKSSSVAETAPTSHSSDEQNATIRVQL